MKLEKLDASYSNVPILLEVLRNGFTLCVRVYMEFDLVKDHVFAINSDRKVDVNPSDKGVTAAILAGNILDDVALSHFAQLGELKYNNIKLRENVAVPSSCIVINTKLKELTHAGFGDKTYAWLGDHIVYLDKLAQSPSWVDHTLLVGYFDYSLDNAFNIHPLLDIFANTLVDKSNKYNDLFRDSKFTLFDIWIPFKTSTPDDVIVRIYTRKFGSIGEVLAEPDLTNAVKSVYTPFDISGFDTIPVDGYGLYTLRLLDGAGNPIVGHDADIYLDSYSGYLPKTRVSTVGGEAIFKVGALGLEPGDVITLKVGFKNIRGLVTKQITVV